MGIAEVRKRIDQIDRELSGLMNSRMELALMAKRLKQSPAKEISGKESDSLACGDAERESEVIRNAEASARGVMPKEFSARIFREIIEESKRLQEKSNALAGFQGEHGAYSEMALQKFSKDAIGIPCREFNDVFSRVKGGELDFGIVPIENSIEGHVDQATDLLMSSGLFIVGEVLMPIHHCLLTLPETDYRDVKAVFSHPQALGQCRAFLERNKLEARPYYDTAGAAMMLLREKPRATAVIASRLCAEIYGMEVLKENIEENDGNTTRFLIIAREMQKEQGDKCTVTFALSHKAGALVSILRDFSDAGINLTKIESRPLRNEPNSYGFIMEFLGSGKDEKILGAMEKAKQHTGWIKLLGCYRGAKK
ncbi:Prephenate dehydratase [uncultured archaeon]|nr:Prephenate dehydratase [uncultured archaeon]